jgi:serine/threonine-protein kinase ULK/ATG1
MLKIADFGFARSLPSTALAETLCGSPLYMAPEILRYEKYDAKADLWSVGTVLYEAVTSKPPFRASNHVELLRRIEKGDDRIKFPEDVEVSDEMKKLIRSLLKRAPKERLSFPDFFSNEIITGPIPGLHAEDQPNDAEETEEPEIQPVPQLEPRRRSSRTDPSELVRPGTRKEPESPYSDPSRPVSGDTIPRRYSLGRRLSNTRDQTANLRRFSDERTGQVERPASPNVSRPPLLPHATAPGRQELVHRPAATSMTREASGG